MGANAQTSVPTFTAGEVLTANNMNISARTGVPVFADTTARDAGFGGTGEKTLAEGQLAYIENLTGDAQIQYYDGSTWNSLGASGLTLISSTTIGTTVSSVTVSNAFSATYDNYLITVNGGVASAAGEGNIKLGASTTGYYRFAIFGVYTSNTVSGFADANGSTFNAFQFSTTSLNGILWVFDPFNAKNTHFNTVASRSTTTGQVISNQGYLADTTSYTAFTITPGSGTLTGGTIRVYGLKN